MSKESLTSDEEEKEEHEDSQSDKGGKPLLNQQQYLPRNRSCQTSASFPCLAALVALASMLAPRCGVLPPGYSIRLGLAARLTSIPFLPASVPFILGLSRLPWPGLCPHFYSSYEHFCLTSKGQKSKSISAIFSLLSSFFCSILIFVLFLLCFS
jgi:hypothetical protein